MHFVSISQSHYVKTDMLYFSVALFQIWQGTFEGHIMIKGYSFLWFRLEKSKYRAKTNLFAKWQQRFNDCRDKQEGNQTLLTHNIYQQIAKGNNLKKY